MQSTTTPINSNFETGLGGWTVSAPVGTPGVGWAADATLTASAAPGSPPNSLNFNDGTDFSNGVTVSGSATSPSVSLAGATSATLTFVCMYQTETASATGTYDQRRVQMSTTGFTGTPPFNTQLGSTGTSPCGAMLTWHTHSFTVPTALLAANFQVRFFFDSVDSALNNGQGWFVDNVVVTATGTAPPPPPPPPPGGGGTPASSSDDDERTHQLCGGGAAAGAGLAGFVLALLAGLTAVRRR